jgi:glycosyltransferase involved in cell wall biosynthesis
MAYRSILVDAREFVSGKTTGIGRFLEGLVDCLAQDFSCHKIILLCSRENDIPSKLKKKKNIEFRNIYGSFLKSEIVLSKLSQKKENLFISPYPKLPLFGVSCPSVNTIHDVLDLTHPAYPNRLRVFFDTLRIKAALRKADLTWYDSESSMQATEDLVGFVGKKPRVRYPGINEAFNPDHQERDDHILNKYRLKSGYILVIGNGLPHKNLGILLEISGRLTRKPVFVGVPRQNRKHWQTSYPAVDAIWIRHIADWDLPAVMRGAFCLAQPSTAEGYGYPPLEAMACGVPAVVSNIPVLVESTGGNALIAESILMLENEQNYQVQAVSGLKWVDPLKSPQGWTMHLSDIEQLLEAKKSFEA